MNKPESNLTPVNPPNLRSHIVAASTMPWQPTEFAGIEMKILYQDGEGRSTILFRMAPGAVVPLHEHTALEQTYMLEGSLEDAEGSLRCRRLRVAAGRQHPCRARAQWGDVPGDLQPAESDSSTGRSFLRLRPLNLHPVSPRVSCRVDCFSRGSRPIPTSSEELAKQASRRMDTSDSLYRRPAKADLDHLSGLLTGWSSSSASPRAVVVICPASPGRQ